jgi:hypothetical protein
MRWTFLPGPAAKPKPAPISEEYATLRRRIAEACVEIELDPETRDCFGRPFCSPEGARAAIRALDLMFKEQDLLIRNGVDWDIYWSDLPGSSSI